MNIAKNSFVGLSIILAIYLAIGCHQAKADSELIRVEGATPLQLFALRTALEKAAYGPSPTTVPAKEDACEFYKPPQKLRLLKRIPTEMCRSTGSSAVIADTASSVIFLCKDGVTVADYDFSMGRNGTGKREEGDRKTPIGKYPLGRPTASDKFKVFVPIGFPTTEQLRSGFSGSDIGIHGPSRTFRCMGFLNVLVDWTQGCLAVSSDIYVKQIARFIETNDVRTITIL